MESRNELFQEKEKDKPGWAGTRSGEFHVWAFQQLHMFLKSAFILLSYSQFRNMPLFHFHQWCSGPYQQSELINQLRSGALVPTKEAEAIEA